MGRRVDLKDRPQIVTNAGATRGTVLIPSWAIARVMREASSG